ncbi:MAG: ChaN family lipoprotein, partial [Phycisphaerae bacterium]
DYRAGLEAEQRQWLPVANEYLDGPYRERFAAIAKTHGGTEEPTTQPASQPASQPSSQPTTQSTSQPVSRPASSPTTPPDSQPVSRPAFETPAGAAATMPAGGATSMPATPAWQDLYKAQLLWDEAMAEAIANFRDRFPRHRVLLIVGSFHVAHQGGTALKLQRRHPHDKLLTIVYRANPDGQFAFREEDRHAGDIVVYGLTPPKPKKETTPTPPAETQPTTAPAPMPASTPA